MMKEMLMLTRVLSWNLHSYDRRPERTATSPAEVLTEKRKLYAKMITKAVSGEEKSDVQKTLYTQAVTIFGKCMDMAPSATGRQAELVDAGYRLGFVTHVLALTGFSYTSPNLRAVRAELYRSLAHLAKFLGHPITAENPIVEHPGNATV